MRYEQLIPIAVEFVREYEMLTAPVAFVLAFVESFAFLSLLVPATVLLLTIGALIGASGIGFWPVWLAAALGAGVGDGLAYWIGGRFQSHIWRVWPLSRSPRLQIRARRFFSRWGAASVFIGRFSGPLRAAIPLVAGACAMPSARFQMANWLSAPVWAAMMLVPGTLGVPWVEAMLG